MWACPLGRLEKLLFYISNSNTHPLETDPPFIKAPSFRMPLLVLYMPLETRMALF